MSPPGVRVSLSMRPSILNPLFASIDSLPGIGRKTAQLLEKVSGPRVLYLLWHQPTGVIDRRYKPDIGELADHHIGKNITLRLTVGAHRPPPNKRVPYRVSCRDNTGSIDLVFFRSRKEYLKQLLPEDTCRIVSGRLERYAGKWQIPHPDHVVSPEKIADLPEIEPVYRLTEGLSRKIVLRTLQSVIRTVPDLPEWLDAEKIRQHHWPGWRKAVEELHRPGTSHQEKPARRRLAYDELLANQLSWGLTCLKITRGSGRSTDPDSMAKATLLNQASLIMTPGQETALRDIENDMRSNERMLRLLQGDVGSGKTLVAALAIANTIASGRQALFMAPTELLARQHWETLSHFFAASTPEANSVLLTGRSTGTQRRRCLEEMASGSAMLAVGTHALFQDTVRFHDVGLVVIDEQHRFGVDQRMRMQTCAPEADILMMTATPIPRSLTLALYGGIPVSRIHDKPPGRHPIDTRVLPLERIDEVCHALSRKLKDGERVYWICPVIEEENDAGLTSVTARYAFLNQQFPDQVGLVHGGLATKDKEDVMQAFAAGRITILVATTVIEVGIDVPEATLMIIEHAERYGLAQLHQLRGRVGRGTIAGVCLLLYASPLSKTALSRLKTLRHNSDGFEIAEQDLLLRGSGDMLGVRQSGLPDFKLADLATDHDLLATAAQEAQAIIRADPDLKGPRGPGLRILLYLFEHHEAIRRARSG